MSNGPGDYPAEVTPDQVFFGGGLPRVIRRIAEQWEPDELPDEKAYQEAFYSFLQERAEKAMVLREHLHNGGVVDFFIRYQGWVQGGEVFVEMKAHVRDTRDIDRLVGQIMRMEPKKNAILVVLCGETTAQRAAYLQDLRKTWWGGSVAIVVK